MDKKSIFNASFEESLNLEDDGFFTVSEKRCLWQIRKVL